MQGSVKGIDPQLQAILDGLEAAGLPPYETLTAEQARALSIRMPAAAPPGAVLWEVRNLVAEHERHIVPVRLYRPHPDVDGLILFLHGGGWVLGNLDSHDALCRRLALRSNMVIVSVDYRLAPEHPAPAALEDSWAALNWASSNIEQLTGGRLPIAIAGDSAGGNLAIACAMRAKDEDGPDIFHQLLLYPVADCDFSTASYLENENAPILSRALMQWFWDHYCPDPERRQDWQFSPLRRLDVPALSPTTIVTAQFDPLRDEGDALAAHMREAGVAVKSWCEAGLTHAFAGLFRTVDAADRALDQCVEILRSHLPEKETVND
jgi:acetyl esterase